MAVFVAGTDETAGPNHRSQFFRGGYVAPESSWTNFIVPAWQERVLDGPPAIPYLHMTDMRSPAWRAKHGLSPTIAEQRVDEAFRVIRSSGSLYTVTSDTDAGHFRDAFSTIRLLKTVGSIPMDPEFLCFLAFVFVTLGCVKERNPDAEKVDFVIENNGNMTKHIKNFYDLMGPVLEEVGRGDLCHMLGELIPGGKERVPLQIADVLCWHVRRRHAGMLDRTDGRRYAVLAKKLGWRHQWTRPEITSFARDAALASGATGVAGEVSFSAQ